MQNMDVVLLQSERRITKHLITKRCVPKRMFEYCFQ